MFDDRLKKLRDEYAWTQKQVSEKLNMNPRTYSSYENNDREPNSEVLISIADLFNVSVDYLLGLKEPQKEKSEETIYYNLIDQDKEFFNDYLNLSVQGKEYMRQTMVMVKETYKKDNTVSDMGAKIG